MRWPGERDGSRPPGLAPRGGLDKAAVEHLTSGRGATGRGQTPLPFNPFACGTANPKQIRGPGCCPLEHARRPV